MTKNNAPKGKGKGSKAKKPVPPYRKRRTPRKRKPRTASHVPPITDKQAILLTTEVDKVEQTQLAVIAKNPENGQPPVIAARKKTFIEAMVKALGVASRASIVTGIPARTHRQWLQDDEVYHDAIQQVKEVVLDFYEESLHLLIRERNPAAVIFALKTQGKKRGYIETLHSVNQNFDDNNVHFYVPDNTRDGLLEEAQVITE